LTASLRDIRVYTTFPHVCSYLPDQEATTLFIDPRQQISPELYTQLSVMGFRRSGDHIYRPHCAKCNACVPSRVVTNEFQRSKSQERVWRRNSDLTITEVDSIECNEAYDLYRRYIEGRHADGDMYPPDRDQYSSFLNNGLGCTRYFEFRHGDKLIAILVTDQMLDGLSAIYTFYDPTEEKSTLATGFKIAAR
jgi:arginyl-tRNA--protein-N-Asp/Glu arginylyltransferase